MGGYVNQHRSIKGPLAVALAFVLAGSCAARGFEPPAPPGAPAGVFAPPRPPAPPEPAPPATPPPVEAGTRLLGEPANAFSHELAGILNERVGCLPSFRITRLLWDLAEEAEGSEAPVEGGRLFIGTADAGVALLDLRRGTVDRVFGPDNCLPRPDVRALAWDADAGTLHVGTDRGLFEIDPARVDLVRERLCGDDPLAGSVTAIGPVGSPAERAFLVGTLGGLFRFDRVRPDPRRVDSPSAVRLGRVHALKRAGDVVLASTDAGIFRSTDGDSWTLESRGMILAGQPGLDRRGREHLAAAVTGIVRLLDGSSRLFTAAHGLPEDWVTCGAFDRFPGNARRRGPDTFFGLWAGTRHKGFAVGAGPGFRAFDAATGIVPDDRATALAATGMEIYGGTEAGGAVRFGEVRRIGNIPLSRWGIGGVRRLATDGRRLYIAADGGLHTCIDLVPVRCDSKIPFGTIPTEGVEDVALDAHGRLFVNLGPRFGIYRPAAGIRNFVPVREFRSLPSRHIIRLFDAPGYGMHFLMAGVMGTVTAKIGRIEEDTLRARPADPFLTDAVDATDPNGEAPICAHLDRERGFVGVPGLRPLALKRDGMWSALDPAEMEIRTVEDIAPLGAGRTAFATADGLVIHEAPRGWVLEKGTRDIPLAGIGRLIRDPETPDSLFGVRNTEAGAILVHRMGADLEQVEIGHAVHDMVYCRPFLYLAGTAEITFLPIRPLPREALRAYEKAKWKPGKDIPFLKAVQPFPEIPVPPEPAKPEAGTRRR